MNKNINYTTYFIRHSSKLDLDDQTMDLLWEEDLIAIHYPLINDDEKLGEYDNDSLNPDHYIGSGKTSMNIMHEMKNKGGYVFAYYQNKSECKVGFVEPNTEIKIKKGTWGEMNLKYGVEKGRIATLKTLKLTKVKVLSAIESLPYKSFQPRQGTLVRWWKANERVAAIVENKPLEKILSNLSSDQQEVMCAEFLRTDQAKEIGLPQIASMQLPIGRTLQDVDILALGTHGENIIAQVTYTSEKWKVEALSKYKEVKNNKIIMFSDDTKEGIFDGIYYYPLLRVFDIWSTMSIGQLWLKKVI